MAPPKKSPLLVCLVPHALGPATEATPIPEDVFMAARETGGEKGDEDSSQCETRLLMVRLAHRKDEWAHESGDHKAYAREKGKMEKLSQLNAQPDVTHLF